MITSMTAYGSAENKNDRFTVNTEIRSYNHKYLDIVCRTYRKYEVVEEKVKPLITGAISRGRVEVRITIEDHSKEAQTFNVNEAMAAAYHDALTMLKNKLTLEGPISIDLFTGERGILEPVENEVTLDDLIPAVTGSVLEALDKLNRMRQTEGEFIADDLTRRMDDIEKAVDLIESKSSDLVTTYRDRLQERMAFLAKGVVDLDPARITQEAALLADRSDISEEIVRAKSHVNQFRTIMNSSEPAGRKLNFLLQEFNREFNTMGSKAGNADISHTIVEVKAELEKIREQVQNIE